MLSVRPIEETDRALLRQFLVDNWGSTRMVSRGKLHDVPALDGVLALAGDEIVGILTYVDEGGSCEIMTIDSLTPRLGVGRFLLDHMERLAPSRGWMRLWLITTNDNVPAQKFYEDCGWTLVTVHKNALEASRMLKPEIPLTGIGGVPITDELEYEKRLG